MNPANYRLSKEILQDMIDRDFQTQFHPHMTYQDKYGAGKTSVD